MNTLKVIEITAITATVFNIILTLLVLGRDFRSTLHRVYMVWGIAVTLWNFGAFHLSQNISAQDAFFWAKILQLGVIFLPITLFHLGLVISKTNIGRILPVLYAVHGCLAISLYFNLFIINVRLLP